MKRLDVWSSLFWLAVGLFICRQAWDLELGSLHDPGSGFVLFWVGVIMIGLSLAILVQALRAREARSERPALWAGTRWPKVVVVVVVLFVYAAVFQPLGFIVSTVLLLVFLFKAIEPQRWSVAVAGALLSAAAAWAVFQVWLGGQFPAGVLGLG